MVSRLLEQLQCKHCCNPWWLFWLGACKHIPEKSEKDFDKTPLTMFLFQNLFINVELDAIPLAMLWLKFCYKCSKVGNHILNEDAAQII